MAGKSEQEGRLDDLRRRLYVPDATEADLRRYLDERSALLPDEPAVSLHQPPAPRRRRRWIAAAAVVVVAVMAAAIATVVALQPRPHAAQAVGVDVGDGRTLVVRPHAASAPQSIGVSIDGQAVTGQRFTGHGNAVVRFRAPAGTADGGRAMIVLTSAEPASIRWSALLHLPRTTRSSAGTQESGATFAIEMASGSTAPGTTMAAPSSFVYPGGPPQQVAVEAAASVRWTLIVAVTGDLPQQLH